MFRKRLKLYLRMEKPMDAKVISGNELDILSIETIVTNHLGNHCLFMYGFKVRLFWKPQMP